MFGIEFNKKTVLGIDIGTSSIKIVELKLEGEKPVLSNYAWASFDDGSFTRSEPSVTYLEGVLPGYIQQILKKANVKSKDTYVSIPAFGGLITLIDFPEMASGDMEQAIRFEAHKYIPTSLDDVVISWDIVGKKNINSSKPESSPCIRGELQNTFSEKNNNILQVLLVAASKNRVLKYENIIKTTGLKLKSIDIETFPLVRSLIGNDPGNFFIIDIGTRVCNIVLVERGIIKVNRNIDAGGRDLTKAVAKSMGIEYERAEDIKTSEKNFFNSDSYITFITLEQIVNELSRIINSYYKNEGVAKVDGIILSGGTAHLTGVTEYFQEKLKIKTLIGDPFKRVEYDKKLEPVLDKIKTRFSISIGLALKGIDEHLRNKK